MPCMFCGSEENLTREHVFPAFMGGEIEVLDASCGKCNGEFGRLEAALKDNTKLLLNLLQIENRYGEVPTAKVNIGVQGMDMAGLFGFRDGQGEVNLADVVIDRGVQPNGKRLREGFFASPEKAEKFAEAARERGEKVTDVGVPKEFEYRSDYTFLLPFIFSVETRKVIAKIALAAIAHQYGISYARSEHFDLLRQVIKAEKPPVWIFANELFMAAHARTAHLHSIMSYLSAGRHKGWTLVTLFGGLSYIVEIAPDYQERESRQFSIFYDAAAKKPLNPVVLADEIALIGHVLSPATKFEDRDAVDQQWFPILQAYCKERGFEVVRITPDKQR